MKRRYAEMSIMLLLAISVGPSVYAQEGKAAGKWVKKSDYAGSGSNLLRTVFPRDTVSAKGRVGYALNAGITLFDNSKWYEKWDEANVFKLELKHEKYALRIGKGGQIYSIETPIGEICPPQYKVHAWVDDTWLLTT